jgi:murein DD-endopeptidase MepM/ murein hydrolase activator NlpD
LAQYEIKIVSDSKQADKDVAALEKKLKELEKPKKVSIQLPNLEDVKRGFASLADGIKQTYQTIQQLYGILRNVPVLGIGPAIIAVENQIKALTLALVQLPQAIATGFTQASMVMLKAADVTGVFTGSVRGALGIVNNLTIGIAKLGFAFFGITQAINMVQQAYTGFFNQTIGREIQLRETMLKTQTTLASTSKVFSGGKEITDPYEKIVTLTGAISERIDSIRVRSLELAGVTSGEVVEVFNIVSSQIGQIGGGLKDAEDLAINFAAALGTFGIPLYQARQEIGSILRGDITQDSYLAKSLGITNEDVAKAKTAAGGVVKFLQDKLAASMAGQKIAAQSFSGITSNIREVFELVSQNFGAGLLDPLLNGLREVYDRLSAISKTLIEIAKNAGSTIGRIATTGAGILSQATGLDKFDGSAAQGAASKMKDLLGGVFNEIEAIARRTFGAIGTIIESIAPSVQKAAGAAALFAQAVIKINVGRFEAMVSTVTTLFQVFSSLLGPVAQLMQLYAALASQPIVKFFAETATTLAILKRAGLDTIMTMISLASILYSTLGPAFASAVTFVGTLIGAIGGLALVIGKIILSMAALASSLITPLAAIPAASAAMAGFSAALEASGNQAIAGATKMGMFARGLDALAGSAKAAAFSLLASMGKFALIQIGIALLVKAYGDLTRAQDNIKASEKANAALQELATTYKDVDESSSSAARSAKAYKEAIVGSEYNRAQQRLEEINDWMDKLNANATRGIRSFGDLWTSIGGLFTDTGALEKERKQLEELMRKRDELEDSKRKNDDITTASNQAAQDNKKLADQQRALVREVADFKKQQEDTLFSKQQEAARKDIEITKTIGEMRIRDEERATLKRLEGVQGSAKQALLELVAYLSNKKKGELELQAAERSFSLDMAELDRSVADFRLETERRIADIREKIAKYEVEVAQYKIRAAKDEANARNSGGEGGGEGAGGSAKEQAMAFLRKEEGFRAKPYWDNNHWRVGYGSDTMTDAQGKVSTTLQSSSVSQADADRDLGRRVDEAISTLGSKFGEAFKKLPEGAKAALVSILYNYGAGGIPGSVQAGVRSGDTAKLATAIENLSENKNRRIAEANMVRSSERYSYGAGSVANVLPDLKTPPNWNDGLGVSRDRGARKHEGQDLGTEPHAAVAALQNGIVQAIQKWKVGSGVFIKYEGGNVGVYGHVDPSVKAGQRIKAGQNLGRVTNDGTNSHLHYEYWDKNGNLLDPSARLQASIKAKPGMKTSGGGASTASAGAPPVAPTLDDSVLQSGVRFEALISSIKDKARQLLDLQNQIRASSLKEEFEKIGDNLFPKQDENIRQFEIAITDLQAKLQAIADAPATGFDEKAFELATESKNLLNEAARTRDQFIAGLSKTKASSEEILKLTEKANKAYERTVEELKQINTLKERQIELERQASFLRGLKDEVNNFDIQNKKDMIGFAANQATSMLDRDKPGALLRARQIAAEANIATKRIDLETANKGPLTGPALEAFNQLAEKIRAAATQFGELEETMKEYNDKVAQARQLTETVVGSTKNLVSSLLKGGNFAEQFQQYLSSIGGSFIDRAVEMAAEPLRNALQGQFENLLGAQKPEDPMQAIQAENNTKIAENTAALVALTNSLSTLGSGGVGTGDLASGFDLGNFDYSAEFSTISTTLEGTFNNFATGLASSLTSAFSGGGSTNWAQLGFGVLKPLLGGLFGGLFAEGGDPPVGKFSVVGERGPELLVPKSQTTVIPLRQASQGKNKASNLSYMNRQQALQTETLARQPNGPDIDPNPSFKVSYDGERLEFNSKDYIPTSAIPTLMKQGAKESYNYMRNKVRRSPSERRAFGL